MPSPILYREQWLTEAASRLAPAFKPWGFGKFRVTCGWPCVSALSPRRKRIGECHYPTSSADGTHELFISPSLAKPEDVVGTLAHELAHVVAGHKAAHGKGFVRVCKAVGLTKGKAVSAEPGERLAAEIAKWLPSLGPYPHAALVPARKIRTTPPSSVGLECPDCECRVTMSRKMLDDFGAPTCACGTEFQKR